MKKSKKTGFKKIVKYTALGFIAVFLITILPDRRELRMVKSPRDGIAFSSRIALVYSVQYQINLLGLEKFHPFDNSKYKKIYLELCREGIIKPELIYSPFMIDEPSLLLVHTPEYLRRLQISKMAVRYLDGPKMMGYLPRFIIKKHVLNPFRFAVGGTLLAARKAIEYGIGINIGGGYHHAHPERGGGFCLYADLPVTIRVLQKDGIIQRALVIDLDAHQGDGTITCLADDETTFTFSMHMADGYPYKKEQGDWDIGLAARTGDQKYLELLNQSLPILFDKSNPDLVVYLAGCDTLAEDPLTAFDMTEAGVVKRDEVVIRACQERSIPVVMTLGGGYSPNAWRVQYRSIKNILEKFQTFSPAGK